MKPTTLFCLFAIGVLTLTGCQFTITDGYVFDYSGTQANKKLSSAISPTLLKLELDNRFGDVKVTHDPSKPMEWDWDATVWADDHEYADQFLTEIDMLESIEGEKLVLALVMPEHNQALNGVKSILTLNVPAGVAVTSRNSHGGTNISNFREKADVTNSHGDVWVQNVGEIKLDCSHGDITIENALEVVHVTSAHGNVKATNINGLTADGSHSDYKLRNLIGVGMVETQHGNISIQSCQGSLTLNNQHGDIIVDEVVGNVHAESSFGDIRVVGECEVLKLDNQHGGIKATLTNSNFTSIDIETNFDDIKLTLPADANVKLQGDGREFADLFPNQAGGAVVQLEVQHGDVRVEAAK